MCVPQLAACIFSLAACSSVPAQEAPLAPVSVASLLQQETDFSTLPMHRGWRTNLTSSRDPTGGNSDYQQFVSLQGDHAVLANLKGPGAIVRFWTTAVYKKPDGSLTSEPSGWLKIFLDDNPKPVIDEPFADFFGKHAPFTKPLTDHYGPATISYFPIPYARHCLVTLDKPQSQFYQIQSIAFPAGTKVRPLALPLGPADEKAWELASGVWAKAANPESTAGPLNYLSPNFAAGKSQEVTAPAGPGVVQQLRFFSGQISNVDLRNVVLRAWFDDHQMPDIEVPVADFFGNAYGSKKFHTFFLSDNGFCFLTSRFPMPYRSNARFAVENRTGKQQSYDLEIHAVSAPFLPGTEYFHADFNQEITKSGRAHAWLKVAHEPGHLVGVVQTMQSGRTLGFCEGDDQVRVDEQPWGKPTKDFPNTVVGPWNGTGTEDCFNSAWYFGDGLVSRPMNATLVREDLGRIDTLRFFVNDAPVWQDSIDGQIEIGATNEGDGNYYSSVAYWYGPGERRPMQPFPDAAALAFPPDKFTDGDPHSTVIEGESLAASAQALAGTVARQEMPGLLEVWSDGAQLAWIGAKKGDTLDLTIHIPVAGEYSLQAYVGHGPDYGAFNLSVAGKPLPWNDNAYDDEPHNVRQDWGTATLPAGPCRITIKQMDTDARSKGTRYGLDFIELHLNKASAP